MTGYKSKRAAAQGVIMTKETTQPAQQLTLQEQLAIAQADWDKGEAAWGQAYAARKKAWDVWVKADAVWGKTSADWGKVTAEIKRILNLMEQQNG